MNLCIIQARMSSTRLPNKVLKEVAGLPLLAYQIKRVRQAKKIDKIVIATGEDQANDKIEEFCLRFGIDCFRGSEDDVLKRYFQCALKYPQYQNIIRLTGDCPLIDPLMVDQVIGFFESGDYDYVSNVLPPTFPDGMDTEIFSRDVLALAFQNSTLNSEREHVTQYIRNCPFFKKGNFTAQYDFSDFRFTVDNQEDFELVEFLIKNSEITDGYLKHISLLTKHPQMMLKNRYIGRDEGLAKSLKEDAKIASQPLK